MMCYRCHSSPMSNFPSAWVGAFHNLTLATKREQAGSDLHEHAEAGFEQVCEASRHVLDVRAFGPVGVEHFLQNLPKERSVGCLQT